MIITRKSDDFLCVSDIVTTGYLPSDHVAIICSANIGRLDPVKMDITMRKLKNIDIDSFCQDILSSQLYLSQSPDLDSLIDQYESVLSELLDKHAPLITRRITCRPHAPWFDDELREVRGSETSSSSM